MATAFWLAAFVGHGALWVELVNRLHGLGWPRRIIDAATVTCAAACTGIPLAALARLVTLASGQPAPTWLTAYGWACLVVLAVVLVSRVGLRWDPRIDRRTQVTHVEAVDLATELGDAAVGLPAVARLARLPGNQLLEPRLEHLTIASDRLPTQLEGLRVAHLTDLHMSGRLSIEYFKSLTRRVNDWRPDVVCVTGDLVEHTPQLDWVDPVFGSLAPRLGAYFCLGNHDAKIDADQLRSRLEAAGLADAGRGRFDVEGGLSIGGNEAPWFPPGPGPAPDAAFRLALVHTPDRFGWAIADGVDLVLAGHNHGGQVCFPLLGPLLCPSRHGVRYAAGTFRSGGTVMHVGRGTGSLFPLRYGCPPEVALITLVRGW